MDQGHAITHLSDNRNSALFPHFRAPIQEQLSVAAPLFHIAFDCCSETPLLSFYEQHLSGEGRCAALDSVLATRIHSIADTDPAEVNHQLQQNVKILDKVRGRRHSLLDLYPRKLPLVVQELGSAKAENELLLKARRRLELRLSCVTLIVRLHGQPIPSGTCFSTA
jgi:hypothetical protein